VRDQECDPGRRGAGARSSSADLDQGLGRMVTRLTCSGAGFRRYFKPSSGLEPETPSLPWRLRTATMRSRSRRLHLASPANRSIRASGVEAPQLALSGPGTPGTCPQDLSPEHALR